METLDVLGHLKKEDLLKSWSRGDRDLAYIDFLSVLLKKIVPALIL